MLIYIHIRKRVCTHGKRLFIEHTRTALKTKVWTLISAETFNNRQTIKNPHSIQYCILQRNHSMFSHLEEGKRGRRVHTSIIPRLLIGNFQIGGTIPWLHGAITGCLHRRTMGHWNIHSVKHSLDGPTESGMTQIITMYHTTCSLTLSSVFHCSWGRNKALSGSLRTSV